jgi:hypothetical protein
LITFLVGEADLREAVRLEIEEEDGRTVFREEPFTGFDKYGTGRLLLPLAQLRPGVYRLIITPIGEEPTHEPQAYRFRIEP